jgi:AcrR family transcriptional regulator
MTQTLPFYLTEADPPAKRQILRAALKLFATRGLAATSIRDIAKESRYTNPALYKHFAGKEELALYLFERCHSRVWTTCSAALTWGATPAEKLDGYVGCWLDFLDEEPEVIAFLSDSARVLWPLANASVHRRTMIGLARSLVRQAPRFRDAPAHTVDAAAASIQGTIAEVGRMIQVGAARGPARRWREGLVALFGRLLA